MVVDSKRALEGKVDLRRFAWLREEGVRLRREADRVSGERDGLLVRLTAEFGVGTLEDARVLLKELEREEETAKLSFATAAAAWETKWADILGGDG